MNIGHYAAAAVLIAVAPDAPVAAVAVGVAWPDLLWPVLVFAGRERVTLSREDPLQRSVRFDSYPFSHSLLLGNLLAVVPAALFALAYGNWVAGLLFWLAAVSHWVLDLVVHLGDLPVLGLGRNDRKLGAGMWQYPQAAFIAEYLFFAAAVLVTARPALYAGVLGGGLLLHLLNSNSFLGLTKRNPLSTPKKYAAATLVGYVGAISWFVMAWR